MKLVFTTFVSFLISTQALAVREPVWEDISASSKWDKLIERSLLSENKGLLDFDPKDAQRFCPNFKNLDQEGRVNFWTQVVSALAEKESNFKSALKYQEKLKNDDGTFIISRGLLQLSKNSAKAYGCDIETGSDLHKAEANLICGLKIIKRWVLHDKVIAGGKRGAWRGLGRYWGPFRTKKLAEIRENVQDASFCQR